MNDHVLKVLKEIEGIIQDRVGYHGYFEGKYTASEKPEHLNIKIDLLERTLELMRIQHKHLVNSIPIELFLQSFIDLEQGKIYYNAPPITNDLGSGTKPIFLQPKLLKYLFYRHNKRDDVLRIIEGFISVIWESLHPLDFKKTATGVTRCFTNTRFAANTLRDYGLLKFTKREAYKTWELSLPGFLVASRVAEGSDWKIDFRNQTKGYALHHEIRDAFIDLQSSDDFIKRLAKFCDQRSQLCEEFKEGLGRAYDILAKYASFIKDPNMTSKDRLVKSRAQLKKLEADEDIQKFFQAFRGCLNIGDTLNLNKY